MDNISLENGIAELEQTISKSNLRITEGSASIAELKSLVSYAESRKALRICEIGFNAGMSSYAFLQTNPEVTVTSFDIGDHPYIKAAKEHIDEMFPGRHTLIIGDSTITVPEFAREVAEKFDLIFIDGGHTFAVAMTDIINMKELAHKDTAVIMDDLVPWLPWGYGPYFAWKKALRTKMIKQIDSHSDGFLYPRRTWAVGTYNLE